ncbi:MAG: enoyl-CoA hydratase-related protein [Candidatus Thermoplasmatota archaeon]|nr:enoyl-CoA hydratase-related protein [Candidatus Thermoplasmatota archaeon]MCL5731424.1 enoyl-CoA hydratase-related protein [Candidatus Thermoplasmatota archaeon]
MTASGSKNIDIQEDRGVRIITIKKDNPLNPLDVETLEDIASAIKSDLMVTIIRGSSKAFSAGANIKFFKELKPQDAYHFAIRGQNALDFIASYERPVIASIREFALGGGFELALACDIRICTPTTKMGLPEVTLGILPGWGGTQRLRRIVGETRAFEIISSGRMISSDEALSLGIVNAVEEDPDALAMEKARFYAASALKSVAMIKELVRGKRFDMFEREKECFGIAFETEDAAEGVNAFLQKRKPVFKGR